LALPLAESSARRHLPAIQQREVALESPLRNGFPTEALLHRPPGVIAKLPAQAFIAEEPAYCACKIAAVLANQDVMPVSQPQPCAPSRRAHNRFSAGHAFQNFNVRAGRNGQRRHDDGRARGRDFSIALPGKVQERPQK